MKLNTEENDIPLLGILCSVLVIPSQKGCRRIRLHHSLATRTARGQKTLKSRKLVLSNLLNRARRNIKRVHKSVMQKVAQKHLTAEDNPTER